MKKIIIEKEDKKEFLASDNGRTKKLWMYLGMIIDFISTLIIGIIIVFSKSIHNVYIFYGVIYVCLVCVVIGGEFIGTYFGALEQYVLDKKHKKEIDIEE